MRQSGTKNEYTKIVAASIGDRVDLSIAVFNNAKDSLSSSATTVHGLNAEFQWPKTGTNLPVEVTLGGKNIAQVWDGATILTTKPAILKVIRSSVTMVTNYGSFPLPFRGDYLDNLTLGLSTPDGEFPVGRLGGIEDGGFVNMMLEVSAPQ